MYQILSELAMLCS